MAQSDSLTQLMAFDAMLEQHVRWILECAAAAPPGGGHGWDRVLVFYGCSPDSALSRVRTVGSTGQARGAIAAEVRRAADAMVARATTELDRIAPRPALGSAPESELNRHANLLRVRLGRLAEEITAQHTAAVCPPAAAVANSVGSIFANAQSSAKLAPWAVMQGETARVLSCQHCGAPQLAPLNFVCRYCQGHMVETEPTRPNGTGA